MSEEGFHLFLGVMCVIALLCSSLFISSKPDMGCSVPHRGDIPLVTRRRGY